MAGGPASLGPESEHLVVFPQNGIDLEDASVPGKNDPENGFRAGRGLGYGSGGKTGAGLCAMGGPTNLPRFRPGDEDLIHLAGTGSPSQPARKRTDRPPDEPPGLRKGRGRVLGVQEEHDVPEKRAAAGDAGNVVHGLPVEVPDPDPHSLPGVYPIIHLSR